MIPYTGIRKWAYGTRRDHSLLFRANADEEIFACKQPLDFLSKNLRFSGLRVFPREGRMKFGQLTQILQKPPDNLSVVVSKAVSHKRAKWRHV
jgi:hypothetical protein